MRVLTAQATEVPRERLFSAAGNIYTDNRKSMRPETLARLLFIYANQPNLLKDRDACRVTTAEASSSSSDDECS